MRYIDADKLIAHLKDEVKGCEIPFGSRANGKGIAYGTALGLKSAISFAETLSTADVVPKSEVEKIFAEIEEIFNKRIAFYTDMAKQSKFTVKHYAETMIKNCEVYLQEIAELKKKYTEDKYG